MATCPDAVNDNARGSPPQRPPLDPKWQRFAEWMHCVCVVTFDLELGQAMEVVYPPHVRLAESERTNICYLAFPDSNSGCMGDTQFHIRLRVAPATPDTRLGPAHRRYNATCTPGHTADAGHYWGFVYFRQIKDARLPRGYFQKSIVLLTRLPFVQLFRQMCSILAPLYFDEPHDGPTVLEAACQHIAQWPPLAAGQPLTLHLLGTVFQTLIARGTSQSGQQMLTGGGGGGAAGTDNNANGSASSSSCPGLLDAETTPAADVGATNIPALVQPHMLASVQDVDLFQSLGAVLTHVHLLWELVLTAEPIVVMATSPTDCSAMVQALTSIIAPLSYAAESRPYFTIHDSEFKEFTQRPQGPPPIIIGVTNPFFAKTLQHWPHTIRLGPDHSGSTATTAAASSSSVGNSSSTVSNGPHPSTAAPQKLRKATSRAPSGRLLDLPPGLYTAYRPHLNKDTGDHLKKIAHGIRTQRPSVVQSALLRRHLLELTHSFMFPLERYIASLMPLQRDILPFRAAPPPRPFRQDDFLATLEAVGPQLTSTLRGDWPGLYKRFFRSANFARWYELRHQELTQKLHAVHLQVLSQADLNDWVAGRQEVEIVDMILKLRQKLRIFTEQPPLRPDTRDRLVRHLDDMCDHLPDDLRVLLLAKDDGEACSSRPAAAALATSDAATNDEDDAK